MTRSSDVVTLLEALARHHRHPHHGVTCVVPRSKAQEILSSSSTVALVPCACRTAFQRCAKPLDVCLVLGEPARELLERGAGRPAGESVWSSILAVHPRQEELGPESRFRGGD